MRHGCITAICAALAIACLQFSSASARAEVARTILIDSAPSGADVFLFQGNRETKIGTTPFQYSAEFHSEMSVLRLAARKPGYEAKPFELTAAESRIVIPLVAGSFAADPAAITDPALRRLQEQANQPIKKAMADGLKAQVPFQLDLAGLVRVRQLGSGNYLFIPISLVTGPEEFRQISRANAETFVAALWRQVGPALAIPLAKATGNVKGLDGIVLDAQYSSVGARFAVGERLQSQVTYECQGGQTLQSVFDPCATRYSNPQTRAWECRGGTVSRYVYNPCAVRVPVTRTEIVADPKVTIENERSTIRYVLTMSMVAGNASAEQVYGNLGIALVDNAGIVLVRRGSLPAP